MFSAVDLCHERHQNLLVTYMSPNQTQGPISLLTVYNHFDLPAKVCVGTYG